MIPRVYSAERIVGPRCSVRGPEAHHLLHVLRIAVGDSVVVFDGSGAEFVGEVIERRRDELQLRIDTRREANRELGSPLTLVAALPKGDRQRWMVEKCVELGVTQLRPLISARTIAQPTDRAAERLDRYVIEASKQCGRNQLMRIGPAFVWSDELGGVDLPAIRLLAHPGLAAQSGPGAAGESRQRTMAEVVDACDPGLGAGAVAAVGPEGGFTEAELEAAWAADWRPVCLGPRILRVETAAITVAVIWADRAHR